MIVEGVIAKILLLLHAAAAIVLIGSTTHNGILAYFHWRGSARRRVLQRIYVRIVSWAYLVTFVLGLVIYPPFRVRVRADYLDEEVPLATGFFEVKEHWLAVGLLVLLVYRVLAREVDVRERYAETRLYHLLGVLLMVIVWWSVFTGLALVSIRSI